jgi:hypothetical protein
MTPTTNDKRAGVLLILGTLAMIITMVVHPSGVLAPGDLERMLRLSTIVHSFALCGLPLQFLGAWGLARRLRASGESSMVGMVVYGFGLVAVMNAAVMNGLVAPTILRKSVAADATAATIDVWHTIGRYNFAVNQAFAAVFVVASSVAILLWCISGWSGKLPRALAVYGAILAPITVLLLFVGHLRLDVHGFGAVIFTEAAWFLIAGITLLRSSDAGEQVAPR